MLLSLLGLLGMFARIGLAADAPGGGIGGQCMKEPKVAGGFQSNGRVVDNGCHSSWKGWDARNTKPVSCLNDGNSRKCAAAGADAVYGIKLQCKGKLRGSVIFDGGPHKPNTCGGFQEVGTVSFSADGINWVPAASWSCNQRWCRNAGLAHEISHNHDASQLEVDFPPDMDIQYIGIAFGSGSAYMNEISFSGGTTMTCSGCQAQTTGPPKPVATSTTTTNTIGAMVARLHGNFGDQIPLIQQEMAKLKEEMSALAAKSDKASAKSTEQITALRERLEGGAEKATAQSNRIEALEYRLQQAEGELMYLKNTSDESAAKSKCIRSALQSYASTKVEVSTEITDGPGSKLVTPEIEADGKGGLKITTAPNLHLTVNDKPVITADEVGKLVEDAVAGTLDNLQIDQCN